MHPSNKVCGFVTPGNSRGLSLKASTAGMPFKTSTNGVVTMVINTNMEALSTMRTLTESTGKLNKALSRLTSGSLLILLMMRRFGCGEQIRCADFARRGVQNNLTSSLS